MSQNNSFVKHNEINNKILLPGIQIRSASGNISVTVHGTGIGKKLYFIKVQNSNLPGQKSKTEFTGFY